MNATQIETVAEQTKSKFSNSERVFYVEFNVGTDGRQIGGQLRWWGKEQFLTRAEAWAVYLKICVEHPASNVTICTPGRYVWTRNSRGGEHSYRA